MTASSRLEGYLSELRARIRKLIYLRSAAVAAGGILALTTLFVWWLYSSGYQDSVAWTGRVLLAVLIVGTAAGLLWWPLRKLAAKEGSNELERRLPEQRGRIETYLDIRRREATEGNASPLTDLLADDAARLAENSPVEDVIPKQHLLIPAAIAAVAVAALAFLLTAAPGHWGFGTRHLLFGATIPRDAVPVRSITVVPGDAVVRRNSDFAIRASTEGFDPDNAIVYVRFDDEQQWQQAPMQATRDKDDRRIFEFKLYALRGPLHYYVTAENAKSTEHAVTVADLPRIDKVRLTYSYPKWTGLDPLTEETLRDIRAVADTSVKVEVFANTPLDAPALVVDGKTAALAAQGDANVGSIAVKQEGKYHIGARVANEFVALTEDYPIEIVVDEKPTIQILKPGRDWRATSIEEVPVRIQAQDDFRVANVELRYSVNGGKWQSMNVGAANKEVKADELLRLEELGAAQVQTTQLEPGDIVSYYAVAKDRAKSVQTDLFMVQVQPFERRFQQSGGGGGGGGGGAGDEQGAISERQREILLATWNLQRSDQRESRTRAQLEESAKMLAELQTTLAAQARTVAERTRARIAVDSDERVKAFVESMEKAAQTMDPAAKSLSAFKLEEAVPIEQQALQQLLRAEAAFRDVQVSMQREQGGGGGQQAARNFTEMFELEMDVQKNQYEQQSQLSMENKQQEVDEALQKLKELAKRQEKLAEEAQRKQMTAQEQRWRQEQLRREAEDLKRQLAELSRQQQNSQQQQASNQQQQGQQGQQQQGQQSSQGQQQGQQSSQGQQSGQQQANNQQQSGQQNDQQSQQRQEEQQEEKVRNAMSSLQKALDDMKAANQQNQAGDATRSAREASENLKRALAQMDQPKSGQQGLDKDMERFADRTQALSETQGEVESSLNKALSDSQAAGRRRGQLDPRAAAEIAATKQQMATELEKLQREMRESVHKNRGNSPEGSKKLGEIVNELESSGVSFRINRSAAEVLYGRARDAAPREGLISEGLENLERDLREAASVAANDQKQQGTQADPQQLLAQIGELRRALEEARRDQRAQGAQPSRDGERMAGNEQQNGQQQNGQQQNGQQQGNGQENGQQQSENQQGSPGQQSGGNQGGSQQSGQQGRSGQGGARGGPGNFGGNGPNGLTAWNPDVRNGSFQNLDVGNGRLRDAQELSERVQDLANRMGRSEMTPEELRALQRMAHDLRRLTGNPIATNPEAVARLVDQLELATLAAVQKSNPGAPPRTAVQSADSTEYREAVAEYYRRLGGS